MGQSRRSILRASGVVLVGLVAGCGQDSAASGLTDAETTTPDRTPTGTDADRTTDADSSATPTSTRAMQTRTQTSTETTQTGTPTSTPTPPEPRRYDGFEEGALADAYVGDRDQYVVTDDGIAGDYALQVKDSYAPLTHESASTPRGCEYRATVRVVGAPNVRVNVQNPSSPRDPGCYSVQLHQGRDLVRLYKVSEDTDILLDSIAVDIDEGDVLVSRLQVGDETVRAIVEDRDGDELGRTDEVEETTFAGGTYGFHTYGTPGSAWDGVRRVPL